MMTNPLVRSGVWCVGVVEKLIPNIENVFTKSKLDSNIVKKTEELAIKLLKKYDRVILGHTHKQIKMFNGKYFNCGTCQNGRIEYIIVDNNGTRLYK